MEATLAWKLRMVREGKMRVLAYHNHKGGGTNLCRFFQRSILPTPRLKNCNEDASMQLRKYWNSISNARELEATPLANYSVLFVENEFPLAEIPQNMLTITTLREPLARHVSHIRHWQRNSDEHVILRHLSTWIAKYNDYQARRFSGHQCIPQTSQKFCRCVSHMLRSIDLPIPTAEIERSKLILLQLLPSHDRSKLPNFHDVKANSLLPRLELNAPYFLSHARSTHDTCDRKLLNLTYNIFRRHLRYHKFL